jgi:alanine racemase
MNLTMVNLTGCRAKAGDVVTLLGSGPQGRGLVDPGQAAASIGTISYELVTRIASSLPRRLVA